MKMNKLTFLLGLFLFSASAWAGTCGLGTVSTSGGYSFSLAHSPTPSSATPPFFYAGRMTFNGGGTVTSINLVESQAGFTRSVTTTGSYTLPSTCLLTITFSLPALGQFSAKTFTVSVYLDQMDSVSTTNAAYHGNAVFKTNIGMSGIGVFDRGFGKFN